jgi:hypothetical protein
VKWRFQTGGSISSSASIDRNGNIFFGSGDHKIYALSSRGEPLWSFETGGEVVGTPVIGGDGTLYVGSGDGILYAFGTPEQTSVRIIQPRGGESLKVGEEYEIKWETINPPQGVYSVRISLLEEGKIEGIMAGGQDTGSFVWIPEFPSRGCQIQISLLTPGNNEIAQAVSGEFRILTPFSDVPLDYWALWEIMCLANGGVINGYPDGTFKPELPVTRAEFSKMALLYLRYEQDFPPNPTFPDLDPREWYYGYVEGAVKAGLVKGYPDGTFKPQGNITIAEVLTMIVRAAGWNLVDPPATNPTILIRDRDDSLRRISPADWFYQYVGAAVEHGILRLGPGQEEYEEIASRGGGGEYIIRFNTPATRAQTSVFLVRRFSISGLTFSIGPLF